jgi:hypothetical protein
MTLYVEFLWYLSFCMRMLGPFWSKIDIFAKYKPCMCEFMFAVASLAQAAYVPRNTSDVDSGRGIPECYC